jgi:NAD(P)-dependent dehydrogenase (short-subunit alcohol dehydrogenase family)
VIDSRTFRLDGRLALVTGSSTGIGLALARGLAQAGAPVVLNGRDRARLESAWLSITAGCSRCSQGPAARPCGRCPVELGGAP